MIGAATRAPFRRPAWLTLPVILGALIVAAWIIVALTIPLWSPYDPVGIAGRRLQPRGIRWSRPRDSPRSSTFRRPG